MNATESKSLFPTDITDKRFTTASGTSFTVLRSKHFPAKDIATQHRKYLTELRPGLLVSVSFYGQPVAVITVEGGVVRLDKIEVDGVELTGSTVMSRVLEITKTRQPVRLSLG